MDALTTVRRFSLLSLLLLLCLAACGDSGLPTPDAAAPDAATDGAAAGDMTTCESPTGTLCDTGCVDPQSDDANCGACGMACSDGQHCVAGACQPLCPSGEVACGVLCANLQTDSLNCGGCNMACPVGTLCSRGTCLVNCQQGLTVCGGSCVDLASDAAHCGDCTTTCPMGYVCSSRQCALSCQQGLTNCGGVCTNLATDVGHCGGCGNTCPGGNVCASGKCVLSCQEGLTNCGGTCVDLSSSDAHCGDCSTTCGGGHVCQGGTCVLTCQTGLTACGGTCTDTQSDPAHCGGCATACATGRVCSSGKCVVTCAAGQTECSGACTNLQSDNLHCGDCATACAAGSACSAGQCVVTCVSPSTVCGGACVDTRYDPANCGGCGTACPTVAHGTADCSAGTCGIASCSGLFRDCNSDPSDGCETDTSADFRNCGACNHVCSSGVCASGQCAGACNGTVLVIADDQRTTSDLTLAKLLQLAGLGVTVTSLDMKSYTGSPDPAGFGAVVILVGGEYASDMPAAGQQAIVDAAAKGTGVVFTEWGNFEVAAGHWQLLSPLMLLRRGQLVNSTLTYAVDGAFASHPIWSGLPSSFTLASPVGTNQSSTIVNGGQRIAGSTANNQPGAGVVIRDATGGSGRVVELSFAADWGIPTNSYFNSNGWVLWQNDSKLDLLVTNSVLWATGCK